MKENSCPKQRFHLEKVIKNLCDTAYPKTCKSPFRLKLHDQAPLNQPLYSPSTAPNQYTENETIAKYEIMDGAPVRGESIPIRLFLSGYELTPTMKDINKKFSVRYYLNLVLVDEEERRYFKQQVSSSLLYFLQSLDA